MNYKIVLMIKFYINKIKNKLKIIYQKQIQIIQIINIYVVNKKIKQFKI